MADTAADGGTGQTGINIMIAGLASQVASLFAFVLLCADFAWKVRKNRERSHLRSHETLRKIGTSLTRLKVLIYGTFVLLYCNASWLFVVCQLTLRNCAGMAVATLAIFIRSCFRIAELQGGFGGKLANQQISFIILEGAMIAISALALTIAHPGFVFKRFWKIQLIKENLGCE